MPDRKEINKRGYLKEDFRLFHLKDSRAQKVDYHYHAFDKLILLLGGKVTYVVEGVTYFLQPWDLLLVGHDLIHRPIIDPAEPYERVVIWLGRGWLGGGRGPPPMPTRLETTPMIPPATLMPPRPGRWRDGLGFLPLSIWVITKKRKATKKS